MRLNGPSVRLHHTFGSGSLLLDDGGGPNAVRERVTGVRRAEIVRCSAIDGIEAGDQQFFFDGAFVDAFGWWFEGAGPV